MNKNYKVILMLYAPSCVDQQRAVWRSRKQRVFLKTLTGAKVTEYIHEMFIPVFTLSALPCLSPLCFTSSHTLLWSATVLFPLKHNQQILFLLLCVSTTHLKQTWKRVLSKASIFLGQCAFRVNKQNSFHYTALLCSWVKVVWNLLHDLHDDCPGTRQDQVADGPVVVAEDVQPVHRHHELTHLKECRENTSNKWRNWQTLKVLMSELSFFFAIICRIYCSTVQKSLNFINLQIYSKFFSTVL